MNLPKPVAKKSYNKLQKLIAEKAIQIAKELLDRAAKSLFDITAKKNPENIVADSEGDKFAKVAVTVDGTWMKRGHQSKLGVVFVQSVETGEVLDYAVKSLFCHMCSQNRKKKSPKDFADWFQGHEPNCSINHKGSSDKMESDGAKEIFLRSTKRNLIYTLFVGDGDSSSFGLVKDACFNEFGDFYTVTKEECSGHVQKRMGTRLREFKRINKGKKLNDGRSVSGRNRLTDKWIDDIQKYYGQAIRGNVGDKEGMRKAIWAIYNHCICDENQSLDEQHSFCPKDGWCRYWSNRANYNSKKRLPAVFRQALKPTFDDLSKDLLLDRCLIGLTQNQNEAINGVLWRYCPKNTFIGRKKLELGVCQTIGKFNAGACFTAELLRVCGIKRGENTIAALVSQDKKRKSAAQNKISASTRIVRQKLRSERKKKSEPKKTTYLAGAFGLSSTPDIDLGEVSKEMSKRKKNKPKQSSSKKKQKIAPENSAPATARPRPNQKLNLLVMRM